jgi:DNA-binding MarR family transcriptional regulator
MTVTLICDRPATEIQAEDPKMMQSTVMAPEYGTAAGRPAPDDGAAAHAVPDIMEDTYGRLTRLIERLHRRHLDMLRLELDRLGIDGINPAQALMLLRLDGKPVAVRDLIERGYYLGSNVSYNIKQLVKAGYTEQERSPHDRRSLRILVTGAGRELCARLNQAEAVYAGAMAANAGEQEDLQAACRTLRHLEQLWSEHLRFDTL